MDLRTVSLVVSSLLLLGSAPAVSKESCQTVKLTQKHREAALVGTSLFYVHNKGPGLVYLNSNVVRVNDAAMVAGYAGHRFKVALASGATSATVAICKE